MEAKIDRFGRILIPGKLRGRLGLKPGSCLRIEAEAGALVLTPAGLAQVLEVEDGLLVFAGEADGDIEAAVEALREERLTEFGAVEDNG